MFVFLCFKTLIQRLRIHVYLIENILHPRFSYSETPREKKIIRFTNVENRT